MNHIATGGDPFELGSARPLDFGHWAAHKLEQISAFRVGHGQAVAIELAGVSQRFVTPGGHSLMALHDLDGRVGLNRLLADVFSVYIKVANSIPCGVLGSIFIIALGLGMASKVALAVVMVFFVVFGVFVGARRAHVVLVVAVFGHAVGNEAHHVVTRHTGFVQRRDRG